MTKARMSAIATVAGILLLAFRTITVDWTKVFRGDPDELAKIGGAMVIAVIGYLTQQQPSDVPVPKDIASKTDDPTVKIEHAEVEVKVTPP